MTDRARTIIAIDANVLINFIHIELLSLLGALPDITFMVPKEVTREVTDAGQAAALEDALAAGHVHEINLTGLGELEHRAVLIRSLGKGESACLALARSRDWSLASDEKRLFRRTAIAEIGESNIWTTPSLIAHAQCGAIAQLVASDRRREHGIAAALPQFADDPRIRPRPGELVEDVGVEQPHHSASAKGSRGGRLRFSWRISSSVRSKSGASIPSGLTMRPSASTWSLLSHACSGSGLRADGVDGRAGGAAVPAFAWVPGIIP